MMNSLYVLGGGGYLALGVYIVRIQFKRFWDGKQDELGFDIKLLGGGVMAITLGIVLIVHFI